MCVFDILFYFYFFVLIFLVCSSAMLVTPFPGIQMHKRFAFIVSPFSTSSSSSTTFLYFFLQARPGIRCPHCHCGVTYLKCFLLFHRVGAAPLAVPMYA